MMINQAIHDLEKNGFTIIDDFLTGEELTLLQKDYVDLRDEGKFKRAGIGKGAALHLNEKIRSDETYWLDSLALNTVQQILWDKLEILKQQLNQNFYLGLWDFEAHYSYYPIGGLYQAHLDRFSNDDTRTISMVLYLNPAWVVADGGALRIFQKDLALPPIDINPIGGRLVCFFSADIKHEVLITHKLRMGFAGWWKRR